MHLAYTHKPESRSSRGFTIVELLIVVVVIGILAAISLIAFTAVQINTAKAVLQSDLKQASKDLDLAQVREGSYPGDDSDLSRSEGTNFEYNGGGDSYCLTAWSAAARASFHISNETGNVQEGTCSGHTGYVFGSGGGEIVANSPIQNVTQAQCAALPTFDGSNNAAVRTVTDARGDTTRTYEIAKLADGKCWMLTNLKLGSTSESITLTSADSDITDSFTLPQVITLETTSYDHDIPRAIGPVPGDTGAGSTNYGYLYSWPAVTAGETQTSVAAGNNAPHSICPAGWRLPTGGSGPGNDFGDLSEAFGSNGPANIASWQYTGAFKGVYSGIWNQTYAAQGAVGYLWSRSAVLGPSNVPSAFITGFASSAVDQGSPGGRANGFSVRCLLG